MRSLREHIRRPGSVPMRIALVCAIVVVAGAGAANEAKVVRGDAGDARERGRVRSRPMTTIQGTLTGSVGAWSVAGRSVRFAQDCSLVDQTQATGLTAPRSGVQVVLMGREGPGGFVVRTGMVLPAPGQDPPARDEAREHIVWSAEDPTVGESGPKVPN